MKYILIMLLVLSSIVFTGCFFYDEEMMAIVNDGDYTKCATLDESEDDTRIEECEYKVAKKTGDESICEQLPEENLYHNWCYRDVAIEKADPDLCDKIKDDPYDKGECIKKIALKEKDIDLCTRLPIDSEARDGCYLDYFKEYGDKEDCASIQLKDRSKDFCYSHFGMENDDRDACDKIVNEYHRENCLLNVAIDAKENLICLELSQRKKEDCIIQTALETPNIDWCYEHFKDRDSFNFKKCIQNNAIGLRDDSYCAGIQDDELALESCQLQVANAKSLD